MATYIGGSGLELTEGEVYEILDDSGSKIKVEDDNGTIIWVPEDFFQEV